MPTQPLALLQLGARSDGLTTPGLHPWHIKVAYQTYKLDGHRKATGTFEEWWAAPNQYHLAFSSKGYQLEAWVTPHGSFAIGDPNLPMPERLVYHWIVAPIPQHPDLIGAHLRYRVRLIGALQFPCVQIDSRMPTPGNLPPQYPTYCFESSGPMLRIADTRVSEIVATNAVAELRGQYLAQSLYVVLNGEPILRTTLLQGESYPRRGPTFLNPSFLTPPANAKPAPPPSTAILYLTAKEAATHLIPPPIAHNGPLNYLRQIQAYTAVAASISTDGRVQNVHILGSTDPALISSIYQAVSGFRYRPFLLHGTPAAVRTRIILDFREPLPQ